LRQAAGATKQAFNRADALLASAQAYLRGDRPNHTPVEVMVTIPISDLRQGAANPTDVGCMGSSCISTETARRLGGDTACTYPGCTHRVFLEGHPIRHWADGGETSLGNIALLCSLHDRYVHEYGYGIELGLISDRSSAIRAVGSCRQSRRDPPLPIWAGPGSARRTRRWRSTPARSRANGMERPCRMVR
jgi:hypothetical protein